MSETRRIIRRFAGGSAQAQVATPVKVQEPTKGDDEDLEEDQPVVVRRRTLTPSAPPTLYHKVAQEQEVIKAERKPVQPAPVEEYEDEEKEEFPAAKAPVTMPSVRTVNEMIADDVFTQMFQAMQDGTSFIITKLESGKWQITSTNIQAVAVSKAAAGKLTGKAYWDEVCDPKYVEWSQDWGSLTYAERKARCKKAGVTWVEDKNPKMDAMKMTEAYREKLDIQKYKPEYRTIKARAAIRG